MVNTRVGPKGTATEETGENGSASISMNGFVLELERFTSSKDESSGRIARWINLSCFYRGREVTVANSRVSFSTFADVNPIYPNIGFTS
jgi:hypothetical protein